MTEQNHVSRWTNPPDVTWPLPRLLLDTAECLTQYASYLSSRLTDYYLPSWLLLHQELDRARSCIPRFFENAVLRCAVDERSALKTSLIEMQEELLRRCSQVTRDNAAVAMDVLCVSLDLSAGTLRKLSQALPLDPKEPSSPAAAAPTPPATNEVPWTEEPPADWIPNVDAVAMAHKVGNEYEIQDLQHLNLKCLNKLLRKPGFPVRFMSKKDGKPAGRVHADAWERYLKFRREQHEQIDAAREQAMKETI